MSGPGGETRAPRTALVLDAGGARSAYQVGALGVLLPELDRRGARPSVVVGTSAGALLAAALAAGAHLPAAEQAGRLETLLDGATKPHVITPLWRQVPSVLARYASETVGLSVFRLRGLFGTGPLSRTLHRSLDWPALHGNLEAGHLEALAVVATSVRSGRVTLFTEGSRPLPTSPPGSNRRYVATRLAVEHLLASSAIPALFPAVRVDGPEEAAGWYVDGATRRRVPLAPALELGADRVVVVGTGSLRAPAADPARDREAVDLGDAGATLLGAVMDDPLRHDLRRLAEVNAMAADPGLADHLARHRRERDHPAYRVVPHVAVLPEDGETLSGLAMEVYRANHGSLRRTLGDPDLQVIHRLLGSDSPLQGELLSYLLFDRDFFDAAAALGRRDARRWLDTTPDLWRTTDDPTGPSPGAPAPGRPA